METAVGVNSKIVQQIYFIGGMVTISFIHLSVYSIHLFVTEQQQKSFIGPKKVRYTHVNEAGSYFITETQAKEQHNMQNNVTEGRMNSS